MKIKQQELDNWQYENAVETLKPIITSWAKKTLEVARALYIAHEKLSNKGYRNDLIGSSITSTLTKSEECTTWGQLALGSTDIENCNKTQEEVRTFKDFCDDIGLSYRTAKRWVSLYDPNKDRVLELAELKEYKEAELNTLFETVRKHRGKEPGWKPEKEIESLVWNKNIGAWTERVEGLYQAWLIEKGYAVIKVDNLISPAPIVNKYGQFGLFSFDYLDSLAERCTRRVEGKGAEDYFSLCQTYKSRIPEGVEVNTVMRIPVIVEAALDSLSQEQKKMTVRLLSEILLTLGGEDA